MGEGFLDTTSIFFENCESTIEIGRPNKEIDVFGVSGEAGIDTNRVSATK